MIQKDDYTEFDLKSLFFYILRQWKTVVIFCLAAAVLLGGFMTFSAYRNTPVPEEVPDHTEELLQYQQQLDFLDGRINTVYGQIETTQDYLNHSILMNADPRNIYMAVSIYNVEADEEILPGSAEHNTDESYNMSWYYRQLLRKHTVFEEASATFDIEIKYLMELVDIVGMIDSSFSITVSHPSQEVALSILEFFQDEVQKNYLYLSDTLGEHSVSLMTTTCSVHVDTNLIARQRAAYNEFLALQQDLIALRDSRTVCQQKHDALLPQDAPEGPDLPGTFVKWFLLGIFVGILLAIVLLFLKSILRNRLHSANQLTSCLHATVLGETVRSQAVLPASLRRIHRLEGCLERDSEENLLFLAENIRNHCGDAKHILVCSDAGSDLSAVLAEDLRNHLSGIRLVATGDILKDASALRSLNECDAVLMVARRDVSRNAVIKKMLHLIHSYKKETIGFIISY